MKDGHDVSVTTLRELVRADVLDRVAPEEPLEIQIFGTSLAVLMRTPDHDIDLVTGFLLTERIVASVDDITSVEHCSIAPTPEAADNVVRVMLRAGIAAPVPSRNFFASSSCGVCGKATIEQALKLGQQVTSEPRVAATTLYALADRLRVEQTLFTETGGLHGVGLFETNGRLIASREDIGRHNAVDKVIGAAARERIHFDETLLLVSGRVSFEIVQKAAAVGVPIVAGISAPSSLAVRFGEELGITVIGFLRGTSANVYSHERRVV